MCSSDLRPAVTSPMAVTVVGQGVPGEPQFENLVFLDKSSFRASFSFNDPDSYTRLEYRSTPGAAQSFAGGVSADGTFTVGTIVVAQAGSFDVRLLNNFGTPQQSAGPWKTYSWSALTVQKVNVSNASVWTSPTSATVTDRKSTRLNSSH